MKYIIAIIVIIIGLSGQAQNLEKDDIKVGLVLSGGGAKGLAHIGVLKVIDSLGVRIDYIAGTSMGAIVGGLYASGYSGKDLDSIFKSTDFDDLISDDLPRKSKTFYERNNSEKFAIVLPFDNFKVKLPSALSRGQNAYSLISKLTLPVNQNKNFSDLPIPFFCIATDIETGKAVMLDTGHLPQAVMASGAFPSLFQPVVIDDQILVDGGVVNNYPIDELRKKGMDLIIGVDVQDNLATRDELKSAPEILLQINNYRTIQDMKIKSAKTDVYIKPNIEDFTVISFGQSLDIIESGVTAALKHTDVLKDIQSKRIKKKQQFETIKNIDSIKINSIYINGRKHYTRSYVLGKLKLKPNQKISYDTFNEGVNNLVATNNFESFLYEFKKSQYNTGYDLHASVTETNSTTSLKMGLHFDDLYKTAAIVNLTKKRLLFNNDIASLDLILGDNVRYNFEYLIDNGFYLSFGLRSRYNQFHKNVSADLLLEEGQIISAEVNKLDIELRDQTNQVYLETLFRKDFALSLGAEHKRLSITSETIFRDNQPDDVAFENTDYFSVFGQLKLDTYDNKYFPKRGVYFDADLHTYLFASRFNTEFQNFSIAQGTLGYAFSVSKKLSFNLQTGGGFKIGNNNTNSLDFALGGYGNDLINNFIPFLGYDFISLTGNSYIKAYMSANYEAFKNQYITLEGNWANVDDNIFDSSDWFALPDYRGYALGYAINTFIGPVQAKYSYSPEAKSGVWFFTVGFWF
ncbi:patatin-like phospholipase family protein [Changchengzhania lutea]|uniref:patatin-like phospholipase family protein n=1 Tax=Changchengzhania lutea TaxID=2049305 RepID=UPI00115E2A10|nr:patatin-like phospholipase family protein [Changchengzhania lutea]